MQAIDYLLLFGVSFVVFWLVIFSRWISYYVQIREIRCPDEEEESDSEEEGEFEEDDARKCCIDMSPFLCNKREKPMRPKTKWQDIIQLSFKTKDNDDIEQYNRKLLQSIMNIPHFAELLHSYSMKTFVKSKNKGRMKFLLMMSANTVRKDETIKAVMDLLTQQKSVKELCLDELNPIKVQAITNIEDEDISVIEVAPDLLQLSFETNGENIQRYHGKLLDKILAVPGFEEEVHYHEVQCESETKGKMRFELKQRPAIAMADMAIYSVLKLLRNEVRVNMLNIFVTDAI